MSTNKTKNRLCESFNGFSGLDTTSPIGSERLAVLNNFRILPDGSAMKRDGFRHVCTFAEEIRGEIAYADGEEEIILAAVGNKLVRISVSDGTAQFIELFSSTEGAIKFFEFRGELYIMEGEAIYRYLGGCNAERCIPYIPLYGKHWRVGYGMGHINQPLNMLTPKIKISYYSESISLTLLTVGKKIKEIDAVWFDGELVSPTKYSMHADGDKIKFDNFYLNGELDLYVTLDSEEYRNFDFETCEKISVFDAFEDSRLFAYGGENGGRTYASLPVDEKELMDENKIFGSIAPVYFPGIEPIRFSGVGKITDMCRIYDRMLIFSEHRAWMTASLRTDEGRMAITPLVDTAVETVGCSSEGASVLLGGDNPVTVSHGGIIKWSIDSEFEEEMKLTSLSKKADGVFEDDFEKNAVVCYNRGENELWFAHAGSENGLVVVYNCESGAWYTFDGIPAERFFQIGEKVAFRSGNSFYVFDTGEGYDCFEWGERDIEAVIESAGFDFSCPAEKKHVGRTLVLCDTVGGQIELELSDGNLLASAVLGHEHASKFQNGVDFFDLDMRTGRSERMRFKLKASGRNRQRIYRVDFYAD